MLSGKLPSQSTAKHCARHQQQQRQQINQTYSAQYRTFGDRYDDLVADTSIDWIIHMELARLAAEQLG